MVIIYMPQTIRLMKEKDVTELHKIGEICKAENILYLKITFK